MSQSKGTVPDRPDTQTIRPLVNWMQVGHAERLAEVSEDRPVAESVAAMGRLIRLLDAALDRLESDLARKTEALERIARPESGFWRDIATQAREIAHAALAGGTADAKPCTCGQLTDGFCEAHPLGAAEDTTASTRYRLYAHRTMDPEADALLDAQLNPEAARQDEPRWEK